MIIKNYVTKMSWLSNYIDCVVYLNLDERLDRKERCETILNNIGITPYYRFPAIKDNIGIRGCTLSHYHIIKYAKENNYKNILIFEDDFAILDTSTFKSNLLATLQQIEKNNLSPHMLYLGGNLESRNNQKIDNNLYRVKGVKATHSYIVYNTMYDAILEGLNNIDFADPTLWGIPGQPRPPHRMHIDVYYARDLHPNTSYNIFGCYPCLTSQLPSYSDVEKKVVDYSWIPNRWNVGLKRSRN
jgi:hypothetical protein